MPPLNGNLPIPAVGTITDISNTRVALVQGNQLVSAALTGIAAALKTEMGAGNVAGPASSTDGNIAVFDGAAGEAIEDGGASIAFLRSASNLNAGTVPDARLPARIGATTGKVITDWNDATDFGLYKANGEGNAPPDSLVRPGHTGGGFNFGIAIPYAATYLVQIVTAASWGPGLAADTQFAMRSCRNGTWSAWFKLRWSETEQAALWVALTDLASTSASKGASLVGVQDTAANFTGTTVEAVLAELATATKAAAIGASLAAVPFGDVGTIALVHFNSGTAPGPGGTIAGSNLKYTSAGATDATTPVPAGTWRLMGNISATGGGSGSISLAQRTV